MNGKETAQRFIEDKYKLFIATRATLHQRYRIFCKLFCRLNKNDIFKKKKRRYVMFKIPLISLCSPFNVLHSVFKLQISDSTIINMGVGTGGEGGGGRGGGGLLPP